MGKARNVYFKYKEVWSSLEKIAANEQRSVNFILERAANREIRLQTKLSQPEEK